MLDTLTQGAFDVPVSAAKLSTGETVKFLENTSVGDIVFARKNNHPIKTTSGGEIQPDLIQLICVSLPHHIPRPFL